MRCFVVLQLVAVVALVGAVTPPRFRQTLNVKKTMCSDFPGMSGCAGSDAYACQSKKNPKEFECVTDQRTNPIYRIPVDREEQMPRERWSKCIQCVIDDYAMQSIKKAPKKLSQDAYKGEPYICEKNDARCPLMGLEWEMPAVKVHLVEGDKFIGCMDHSVLCKNDQYKTTCDNQKETYSIIEMVTKAYSFTAEGIKELGQFKKLIEQSGSLLKVEPDPNVDNENFEEICSKPEHPFLTPISGWKQKPPKVDPPSKWELAQMKKNPNFKRAKQEEQITVPPRDIVIHCKNDQFVPMLTASAVCAVFNSHKVAKTKDVLDLGLKKEMTAVVNGQSSNKFAGWEVGSFGQWTGPVAFEDWIAAMMKSNPKGLELCQSILGPGETWAHKFCVFKAADAVSNGNCLEILDTRETYCKDFWGLMPRISPRQMAVLIREEYQGLTPSDYQKIMAFDCENKIAGFVKDTLLYEKSRSPSFANICKLWKEDNSINLQKHDKYGFFQPFKLNGKVYILIEGRQSYLMEPAVTNFVACQKSDNVACFNDWYTALKLKASSGEGLVKPMLLVKKI